MCVLKSILKEYEHLVIKNQEKFLDNFFPDFSFVEEIKFSSEEVTFTLFDNGVGQYYHSTIELSKFLDWCQEFKNFTEVF